MRRGDRSIRQRMRFGGLALGVVLVTSVAAPGCAEADADAVKGGAFREGFDAALPPPLDAGVVEQTDDTAPPTSWRGIYRDFFGRRAASGCAGSGTCHGAVGQQGHSASNFVCADVDQCWESMRSKAADGKLNSGLVDDTDVATPNDARLFAVLRTRNADGTVSRNLNMPQQPADFAFTQEQLARMKTWIQNGAKKD